jgi:hypothetical protein
MDADALMQINRGRHFAPGSQQTTPCGQVAPATSDNKALRCIEADVGVPTRASIESSRQPQLPTH